LVDALLQETGENLEISTIISTTSTSLSSAAAAASSSSPSSSLVKPASDHHIAAEVRKMCVDHSTGETVLHKAARLGYLVTHYTWHLPVSVVK